MATLHLLVPGLFGPAPETLDGPPRPPTLERFLTRAERRGVEGVDCATTLAALWGLPPANGVDLPLAALRRRGDGGTPDGRLWCQLTPVHLRPDRDRLLMFDPESVGLTPGDSQALADLFKGHFAEQGWELEARHPHRWYLALEHPPRITTCEGATVFGRNIDPFLPRGEEALRWHALLNEIQMLFSSAELNQRREAEGRPTVNGGWISGIGREPRGLVSPVSAIYSDDALGKGLALASGLSPAALPGQGGGIGAPEGDTLVIFDAIERTLPGACPSEWSRAVAGLEQWLTPAIDRIGPDWRGIRLYPCDGRTFELTASGKRRFWRRGKPFIRFLQPS
ncbi:MAG: hypothetical protein B0D96_01405 [Candidatus Sedimenticola endophacoides]|uniref:Phosphoglycerate mutase n=2 Tax=Candidatus Sedimenticola endophacoides TaxID=2548426 RepID=A0A6N4DJI1_9GAMM|nr:MAG: hypothetical protein B0D94_12560 [Candidatus Sedimenticola endophacoides]OQX37737.1 MAG: hypothetical protein B0D96_01405 [Candidatus Sedimenticola endophacoides]OQX38799.1 MAG: hypothetical protein B0D89_12050 [Candidatus Sedimenticola endophacoides]PUD98198.1 MAG: hypothetical protein C3L24_13245 [Candidatus Sedimenticola endophacoides]PUE03463.1 MAG: hypothetical protein C3L26_00455 [Candidatus Sedimenticola endophacoides]